MLSQPQALAAYERSLQRLRTLLQDWAAESADRLVIAGRVLAGLEAQCAAAATGNVVPGACGEPLES